MLRARCSAATGLAAAVLVAMLGAGAGGQTTAPPPPPVLIPSMYGGDLFQHYCASCHGRDGKGQGPAAAALRREPPALTTLARRNGGVFPTLRVYNVLAGKGGEVLPPAHGSHEMPVWGPIFRALDATPRAAETRLANLVTYLESLQAQ